MAELETKYDSVTEQNDTEDEVVVPVTETHEPETDEQRKKRERREKSKKIIAAVTDGVRALSNLYFTTQYAPNMYK